MSKETPIQVEFERDFRPLRVFLDQRWRRVDSIQRQWHRKHWSTTHITNFLLLLENDLLVHVIYDDSRNKWFLVEEG